MASTYSDLKIELITTGEQSGSWGTTTNTNLGTALEEAIVGTVDVPFSSGQVTLTLTDSNGTQSARHLRLNLTGTSGGAQNLVVPSIQKNYLINNGTADTITVKTSGGTGIGVPSGKAMWVYNNGTDVVDAVTAVTSLQSDGGVTVDNITIDGTEIDLSSGDLTIDVAGDINLDADGGDVIFKDAGTEIGRLSNSTSDFVIQSAVSDKDMIFKGNDGGSTITALTLDMSAAGAATFNNEVTAYSDERLKDNIETIDNALDKVMNMRGVTFTREGRQSTGVIAQEMQKIMPEVVFDKGEYLSVAYGNLVGVLIEAVKELKSEVDELKKGK
jgi:hypothetical protein